MNVKKYQIATKTAHQLPASDYLLMIIFWNCVKLRIIVWVYVFGWDLIAHHFVATDVEKPAYTLIRLQAHQKNKPPLRQLLSPEINSNFLEQ